MKLKNMVVAMMALMFAMSATTVLWKSSVSHGISSAQASQPLLLQTQDSGSLATYTVRRPIRETHTKDVTFTVKRPIREERSKMVKDTQMMVVREQKTRVDPETGNRVEYTTARFIPEQREKIINYVATTMVPEQHHKTVEFQTVRFESVQLPR